jgi:DNA-binding CsgD family transcriptional regulator
MGGLYFSVLGYDETQHKLFRFNGAFMALNSYSEVDCLVSDRIPSGQGKGSMPTELWSVSFKPDRDTAYLFPYINGALDDALWYERPDHVRFLLEGRRCLLYPERAAAHFFQSRQSALAFIAPLMAFLKDVDNRQKEIRPNHNRIKHVHVLDIFRLLPGTNCRNCGFSTCMAFAAAVARGKATADRCPELSRPMSEAAVYPLLDPEGNLVSALSLSIDTTALKQRIRELEHRTRDLEDRLETALRGEAPAPSEKTPSARPDPPASPLTKREIEVLNLIARGCTNGEIGSLLFISPHTVKSHMINIFNKFGVSDRTEAAVAGIRCGLI